MLVRGVRRVAVGMSGGVDSGVAAGLLRRRPDLEVLGVHMENWDEQDESGVCQRERETDLSDAQEACHRLGVPFTSVSFVKDYWNNVFSSLLSDYEQGFTPNPDILCNRFLKFGSFFRYAKEKLDADFIATGHYAQTQTVSAQGRRVRLRRAVDATKDQTLFLSNVEQLPLQHTVFPLGTLYKSQVRKMAAAMGLDTLAKKRDSTGICFIGKRSFSEFISDYIPHRPGPFIDLETGEELGRHFGVHHYTIGQRARIAGTLKRYYVAARDPETQVIFAVNHRDHPALYSNVFWADEPHWICDQPLLSSSKPLKCMFKFQHTDWTIPALIYRNGDGAGIRIWLSMRTRALTPGQQAVFYDGDICLGSAKILWVDVLSTMGLKPSPLERRSNSGRILIETDLNEYNQRLDRSGKSL